MNAADSPQIQLDRRSHLLDVGAVLTENVDGRGTTFRVQFTGRAEGVLQPCTRDVAA